MAASPTEGQSRSKKRPLSSSQNPLSNARRSSGAALSKADAKVEDLWHRKSGRGYELFAEFYGCQPFGVVVAGEVTCKPSGDGEAEFGLSRKVVRRGSSGGREGQGMSRAAKRRRKKRGGHSGTGVKSCFESKGDRNSGSTCPKVEKLTATLSGSAPASSPLLDILKRRGRQHFHLAPFLASLSQPLPLTFRLRTLSDDNDQAHKLSILRERLASHSNIVRPLHPDNPDLYQSRTPLLNRSTLPTQRPTLHALVVAASSGGLLARQEVASTLPILALRIANHVQPGMNVLDLCAAPGSKTLQALETVAVVSPSKSKKKKRGKVTANDVNPARIDALRDAMKRSGLSSDLTDRIRFTNHDAARYPTKQRTAASKSFDVVLADVPCSGDGTVRKDPRILPGWKPTTALALHSLQKRILVRALQLVKVGGIVSYSTCSFNPMENEAVVRGALLEIMSRGSTDGEEEEEEEKGPVVEVVDVPEVPGLVRREGVKCWKVADWSSDDAKGEFDEEEGGGQLRWYSSYEEAVESEMVGAEASMWPASSSEQNELHLDKCWRLWPQDSDTGGFFVALLRKNGSF